MVPNSDEELEAGKTPISDIKLESIEGESTVGVVENTSC
jgi:hypothetical protein